MYTDYGSNNNYCNIIIVADNLTPINIIINTVTCKTNNGRLM